MIYGGEPNADNTFTLDHIQARVYGGKNKKNNLVGCCRKCNKEKGHKHFIDFIIEQDKARKHG